MPATAPALARTSTDTLVPVLGDLRHSLGKALCDAASSAAISRHQTLVSLGYVEAAGAIDAPAGGRVVADLHDDLP